MLPRSRRLVSAADHRAVARHGHRGRSGPVRVTVLRRGHEGSPADLARVAVVVPKSAGSAPVRNRLRRRLRHLLSDRLGRLPAGSRAVLRADGGAAMSPADLRGCVDRALDAALLTSHRQPRGGR